MNTLPNVQFDTVVHLLLISWALCNHLPVNCTRNYFPPELCGSYELVDLSHHFNNMTIYWTDDAHYSLNVTVVDSTKDGWLQADVLEEAIHGGTHLDAPVHFSMRGWDAAEIPLQRLVFLPVARVDVRDSVASNPEYLLSVSDVLRWEKKYGRLTKGCLFLVHTGQSQYWPNRTAYMGIDDNGTRHFPALSPEAASFLATKRNVFGVGLDSASVDKFGDTTSHRTLLDASIFILENLNALHLVPPRGAHAIILPLKLDGASGSPVRVVAMM